MGWSRMQVTTIMSLLGLHMLASMAYPSHLSRGSCQTTLMDIQSSLSRALCKQLRQRPYFSWSWETLSTRSHQALKCGLFAITVAFECLGRFAITPYEWTCLSVDAVLATNIYASMPIQTSPTDALSSYLHAISAHMLIEAATLISRYQANFLIWERLCPISESCRLAAINFEWKQEGQISVKSSFSAIPSLARPSWHSKAYLYQLGVTGSALLIVLMHSGYTTFLICRIVFAAPVHGFSEVAVRCCLRLGVLKAGKCESVTGRHH